MKKKKRNYKRYPEEFKQEAVALVLEQDYGVCQGSCAFLLKGGL